MFVCATSLLVQTLAKICSTLMHIGADFFRELEVRTETDRMGALEEYLGGLFVGQLGKFACLLVSYWSQHKHSHS